MPASASALAVNDLHVTFPSASGPVHAVRGAELSIAPGEILGLVGESGSGKSVLGMTALGLLPRASHPQISGSVLLDGQDMLTASEDQRRARRGSYITAVFQDPMGSLNPSMRISVQVAEAAGQADREQVVELLAQTGIPEPELKARCYPHELSGGLRQRVMIAMALARNPRLIVADEPTTALDVTTQARVLDLLAHAARERGSALLLITHDLGVAARLCDRIAVAYAGRIVESGAAAQVLFAPRHPYPVGLLASRPRLDSAFAGGELPTLAGQPPDPRQPTSGCSFAARCPAADELCEQPVPVAIESDRRCECHRPGALEIWPARTEPASHAEALLACMAPATDAEAQLACMAPAADTEAGLAGIAPATNVELVRQRISPPSALVLEDVVCEFARPRRRPFAAPPQPLRAVAGVSLTLPKGGSLAIVGESGSGKTTLLRLIVGLLNATSGQIRLAPGAPPQLVFQDAGASLTPWLTIGSQIEERLAALGVPREQRAARVSATLDAVGLPDEVARLHPRSLSGGMRQRAAIARAIAVPPALLACDEPVSALDVSLASQVLNLLCELRAKLGIALLFVTHDLAAARAVAEEIAVMKHGQIVEHASAEELFAAPSHPYTRELLAAVPDVSLAQVA